MWEHIHGLYCHYAVVCIHVVQVAGLSGGIAGYIDDALGGCTQDGLNDVRVHTGSWGVGDNDIGPSVLGDEVVSQDVLHVAGKEQRVVDAVCLRVNLCILDGFRYIFYTDYLAGLTGYEIGDTASSITRCLFILHRNFCDLSICFSP